MVWALLAQHYGRLNTTTGYVAYIYWICGVCHAANVQTEGMVLIFIYYYVHVRMRRTARALRAARSVAPIHTHSNTPPHFAHSPRPPAKCFTFADGNALLTESATMLSVGQTTWLPTRSPRPCHQPR